MFQAIFYKKSQKTFEKNWHIDNKCVIISKDVWIKYPFYPSIN